ncbi:MAG: hypothetical protein IT204_11250 [Fimbriimonadaceae bacterium]|nr:hypothetical protein [Fimbriimonadaceae bacterium]
MARRFASEEALAALVAQWLEAADWEVYAEVQPQRGAPVADLVARRRGVLWVVECKCSLSLALLDQVHHWLGRAHYVSLACPRPTRGRGAGVTASWLRAVGAGWLEVVGGPGGAVQERVKPRVLRTAASGPLAAALREPQKAYAAPGNPHSRRWTPFQETAQALRLLVAAEPGVLLSEAVARLPHHYRSARTARGTLSKWLAQGVISGVHQRKVAGRLRLYPDVGWESCEPPHQSSKMV